MAHFATKRFNYWGQLGVLTAFLGAGLIVGGFASLLPLLGKFNIKDFSGGSSAAIMDKLLVPQNATALRWMQFISTFFLFFLPPFFYAIVCHKKPFMHLGFKHTVNVKQALIVVLIMLACLPIVGAMQELTEMLPWSKATLLHFKQAEEDYNKQVMVIARMDSFFDYLVSVVMIAFLPAVFEETLFRGGLQNLLSRWFKMPIVAVVITSIIFSAVHGSYLGFLSRFVLGFVLGWVYYRTGNIWLNIIGHFFNNAFAVTALYISTKPGAAPDPSKIDDHFPLWIGLAGIAAVYGLFIFFEKLIKDDIDRPGEEVLIPGYIDSNNPFLIDNQNIDQPKQF
ncbi:MAG: CPBP family intramembrane metalloprotease [Ferruginibacter sp.]|nr:CPBP family intramembrane metalloprotease [Ferruginibacter sp.]